MRTAQRYIAMLALLGAGCAGDGNANGSGQPLSVGDGDPSAERGGPPDIVVGTGEGEIVLDCVPGDTGPIHVEFECDSITVYTCKDLSNIVIELADGQLVRLMGGLNGQVHTFTTSNGQQITGVWVKAGENGSGDGPGYGERVDGPEGVDCDPPGAGAGGGGNGGDGTSGGGGTSGSGGGPCEDLDPDTFCGEGQSGSGGDGSAGDGSAGDGSAGDGSAGAGSAGDGNAGAAGNGGGDPCADNDPDTICDEPGPGGNGGDQPACPEPGDPACNVE
jgi:hypothetical protein